MANETLKKVIDALAKDHEQAQKLVTKAKGTLAAGLSNWLSRHSGEGELDESDLMLMAQKWLNASKGGGRSGIPALVRSYMMDYCIEHGGGQAQLIANALGSLATAGQAYTWPKVSNKNQALDALDEYFRQADVS